MSEMVERIARAIDPFSFKEPEYGAEASRLAARKQSAMNTARAAIEAMREPTDQMIGVGFAAGDIGEMFDLPSAWRAMIDSALGSDDGPTQA